MVQNLLLILIFLGAIGYLVWHFRKSTSKDANCKTGCGCSPSPKAVNK